MKKIAAVLAAIVLVLTMSSCSISIDSKPSDSQSSASSAPSESQSPKSLGPGTDTDDRFVDALKKNTDAFDLIDQPTLINLAHSVCTSWDNGMGFFQIGKLFVDHNFDARDSGFFIGEATAVYCPKYVPKIKKAVGSPSPTV